MKKVSIFILTVFIFSNVLIANTTPLNYKIDLGLCNENNSLESFFKSYDTAILKRIISIIPIEDEQARLSDSDLQYVIGKNTELINILGSMRPNTYNQNQMNMQDEMIVFAGLIELYIDLDPSSSKNINRALLPWECIWGVITGVLDGGALINQYKLLINQGASWGTVRRFLWQGLKRAGGWILAAGAIYEIVTECF